MALACAQSGGCMTAAETLDHPPRQACGMCVVSSKVCLGPPLGGGRSGSSALSLKSEREESCESGIHPIFLVYKIQLSI